MHSQVLLAELCSCRLGPETIGQRISMRPDVLNEWAKLRTGSDPKLKALKAFAKAALALCELEKSAPALLKGSAGTSLEAVAMAPVGDTTQALALPAQRPALSTGRRRHRDVGTQTRGSIYSALEVMPDPPDSWSELTLNEQVLAARAVWTQRWRAVSALVLRGMMIAPLLAYAFVALLFVYLLLRPEVLLFACLNVVGHLLTLVPQYLRLTFLRSADGWAPTFSPASPVDTSPTTPSPTAVNLSQPIVIQLTAPTMADSQSSWSDHFSAVAIVGFVTLALRRFEPQPAV